MATNREIEEQLCKLLENEDQEGHFASWPIGIGAIGFCWPAAAGEWIDYTGDCKEVSRLRLFAFSGRARRRPTSASVVEIEVSPKDCPPVRIIGRSSTSNNPCEAQEELRIGEGSGQRFSQRCGIKVRQGRRGCRFVVSVRIEVRGQVDHWQGDIDLY